MVVIALLCVVLIVVVVFVVAALLGPLLCPLVPVSLGFTHLLVVLAVLAVSVLAFAARLLGAAVVPALRFVKFVAASPSQTMYILIQKQIRCPVSYGALTKLTHDRDQTISVKCSIVLLR